jgi:hypothetical protein
LKGALSRLPKRIVVLLDELDRMERAELLSLLKVVRGIASLPNVSFVCAAERKKRTKTVFEESGDDANLYFEKFSPSSVQIPVPNTFAEERNIGVRKRELVESYFALMDSIAQICDLAGELYTAADIGGLSKSEISHRGWWTNRLPGRLGNVAPRTMSYPDFLERCKFIFSVFEGVKSAPLRAMLVKLQVPRKEVKSTEGIKLLAYLCQLATIAKHEGWGLIGDAELVAGKWNKDTRLDFLKPLFGLNGLRNIDIHASSFIADPTAQSAQLKDFGIDPGQVKTEGGLALDRAYDFGFDKGCQFSDIFQISDL